MKNKLWGVDLVAFLQSSGDHNLSSSGLPRNQRSLIFFSGTRHPQKPLSVRNCALCAPGIIHCYVDCHAFDEYPGQRHCFFSFA